jgi:hypothetical protein
MKHCLVLLLVYWVGSVGSAQTSVTCERLLETIRGAFEVATEVKMTTQIVQGKREFAYSKLRLYKDETGTWQSETLEQRGMNRPAEGEGQEDGAQPTFDLNCEGHTLTETREGWDLTLPQQGDSPVKQWDIALIRQADTIVPSKIAGTFEAKILFIPFRGSFTTEFSDWQIPVTAPDPNANNR